MSVSAVSLVEVLGNIQYQLFHVGLFVVAVACIVAMTIIGVKGAIDFLRRRDK